MCSTHRFPISLSDRSRGSGGGCGGGDCGARRGSGCTLRSRRDFHVARLSSPTLFALEMTS